MNVKLPDGTIIQNVPDGTTKAQLVAKLRKAGYDIPELKPKAKTADDFRKEMVAEMSGGEQFLAGVGKGMTDIARGAGQLTGLVSRKDIDESNQLDKALTDTGLGKTGEITGKIASALPAMFIPGVNTLTGAAAVGGGLGALEPVGTDDSRFWNTVMGGAGGVVGYGAGGLLPKVAKGMVMPFFKKGQERIVGKTLKEFAGQNADDVMRSLSGATEIVPGSIPTAAEAAGMKGAGIAQMQRALQSSHPQFAANLAERGMEQNAARMAALNRVTGSADDLASAIANRSEAASGFYDDAFKQTVKVDNVLKSLIGRPSMQQAVKRAADIAKEEGKPLGNLFDKNGKFASVRGLHYVKMALDDMLDDATTGLGKTQQRALTGTKRELLKWLEGNNPAYGEARKAFIEASRPINQMQVGQEIAKRATGNQLTNQMGDMTLYPSAFGRAMKAGEQVAKKTTGMAKGLEDIFEPGQMATLNAIRDDLARTQAAQTFGKSVGSNTAQNLASQNLLNEVAGASGLPKILINNPLTQTVIGRPAQWAAKTVEPNIQDLLAQALLDPKKAALLMQNAEGNKIMMELAKALSQGATTGAAATMVSQ